MNERAFVKDDVHFFTLLEQLRRIQQLRNLPEVERGIPAMTEKVFVKDDTELVAAVERARQEARALGVPEPKETTLGDVAELKAELERWRRERRQLVRAYHVIIEPVDGSYRAYAPAVPEVEGRGKTPQQAKEHLATALRLHLLVRHAEGELPPEENRLVDVVVVSLA